MDISDLELEEEQTSAEAMAVVDRRRVKMKMGRISINGLITQPNLVQENEEVWDDAMCKVILGFRTYI